MFFVLTTSPATFQTFMNDIFHGLIAQGHVAVYMDDILIFMETHEQHEKIVREVLRILREHNLFLKPEKCVFHKDEVEYLSVIIGKNKIHMDSTKTCAI